MIDICSACQADDHAHCEQYDRECACTVGLHDPERDHDQAH